MKAAVETHLEGQEKLAVGFPPSSRGRGLNKRSCTISHCKQDSKEHRTRKKSGAMVRWSCIEEQQGLRESLHAPNPFIKDLGDQRLRVFKKQAQKDCVKTLVEPGV